MYKGFNIALLVFGLLIFTGCNSSYNSDEDLRSVPVTNNPNVVPKSTSMMMPGL